MIRKAIFGAALVLCSFCMTNCGNQKTDSTPAINDSVVITDKVEVRMKIEIPSLPSEQLRNIALEWINETLGGTYSGPLDSTKAMVDYYAQKIKETKLSEMEGIGEDWDVELQEEQSFSVLAHTANFITLQSNSYSYDGGMHGMYGISGITLRASDGRRMDWGIVNEYDDNLQALMKEGLKKYFEVSSDKALKENLQIDGYPHIPLPACAPLFTNEGIRFLYNPYEIAPYMAGSPEFTIPYSQIKPCLNQTGQQLIEQGESDVK